LEFDSIHQGTWFGQFDPQQFTLIFEAPNSDLTTRSRGKNF